MGAVARGQMYGRASGYCYGPGPAERYNPFGVRLTGASDVVIVSNRIKCGAVVAALGFAADTFCTSCIAGATIVYWLKVSKTTSWILISIPVPIFAISIAMAQYALANDGLAHALPEPPQKPTTVTSNTEVESVPLDSNEVRYKHEIQAIVGVLASLETAVRYFFWTSLFLEKADIPKELKTTVASIFAATMALARMMSSSHATCDVIFSKTFTGKMLYRILTLLGIKTLQQFVENLAPLIFAMTFALATVEIPDELNIDESGILQIITYGMSIPVTIIAFFLYNDFIGNEIDDNVKKNHEFIGQCETMFFGKGMSSQNKLQMLAQGLTKFIEIITLILRKPAVVAHQLVSTSSYVFSAVVPIKCYALFQYPAQVALNYLTYHTFLTQIIGPLMMRLSGNGLPNTLGNVDNVTQWNVTNATVGNTTANVTTLNAALIVPEAVIMVGGVFSVIMGFMTTWVILVASFPVIFKNMSEIWRKEDDPTDNLVSLSAEQLEQCFNPLNVVILHELTCETTVGQNAPTAVGQNAPTAVGQNAPSDTASDDNAENLLQENGYNGVIPVVSPSLWERLKRVADFARTSSWF